MKILVFLKKWPGGVGVVVKSVKRELEKRGHEVVCISREEDLRCFSSIRNLLWLRKNYEKIIKKERPDIIYTQDWSMALPLLFPFSIYKKKHFCCFHGNQLGKSRILQKIVGRILGKKLIVVGDSLKKRFPLSSLVYNGVDLKKFKPLKKKRNYLGWIKKDTEIYNQEEIQRLSEELGIPLLIAEKIPFEKMNIFYNKCKIFISLPPSSAGFNLCWLEALAAGVPLVIGNDEGIGYKIPIEKVTGKKEIKALIKKKNNKNSREWVEKESFTWEKNVRRLLRLWGRGF